RIRISRPNRQRLTEAIEIALRLGGGTVAIENIEASEDSEAKIEEGEIVAYSEEFACPVHGSFLPEMSPRVFSFNNPLGACPACQGLGVQREFSPELVIDQNSTIEEGCIKPFRRSMMSGWYKSQMIQVSNHYSIPTDVPFRSLDEDHKDILLFGTGSTTIGFHFESDRGSSYRMNRPWEGVFARLRRTLTDTSSDRTRSRLSAFMTDEPCSSCDGKKLNTAVSMVSVGGISLPDFSASTVMEALAIVQAWKTTDLDPIWEDLERDRPTGVTLDKTQILDDRSLYIGNDVIKEIESRLRFLALVGLDYLTMDRRANTLSGGESQRIRLATQIGTRLTGVMYVLDEPSIGLHPRDNSRLLDTLRELTDLGNTLIVVEHDESTLMQADWLVDLGPGAGKEGGEIIVSGQIEDLVDNPRSETGAYLSGRKTIPVPNKRKSTEGGWLVVKNAKQNNLQNLDVAFPLGCMIAVTGVSGSGKSSLVTETLAPALLRSESCKGAGSSILEMNFLPDVWVTCEVCKGKRYTRETLEVVWKGRTIHDVLDMSVDEACKLFENQRKISRILTTLQDVGLGYIRLGQPATTLSGGEAQRVKLATELHRPPKKHTFYILDEPTTGLSLFDVHQLVEVLLRIRSNGHTVVIVEHHLDVVKSCDWVIDLGPEGGSRGGSLVAQGTPEDITTVEESHTGRHLTDLL
ncbi:MAG: ATP-binding cassette domain-containing protein, partial [Euryarchaeota archaeon]|nr:ATP-binding cassette domain-containing protein [Euryarchaeota archaeon]